MQDDWDGGAIAAAVRERVELPAELERAIKRGPDAMIDFCLRALDRAEDAGRDEDEVVQLLERLVLALTGPWARSPERYPELARAASAWTELARNHPAGSHV